MTFGNDIGIIIAEPCSGPSTWWTGTSDPWHLNVLLAYCSLAPCSGTSRKSLSLLPLFLHLQEGTLGHWEAGVPENIRPEVQRPSVPRKMCFTVWSVGSLHDLFIQLLNNSRGSNQDPWRRGQRRGWACLPYDPVSASIPGYSHVPLGSFGAFHLLHFRLREGERASGKSSAVWERRSW